MRKSTDYIIVHCSATPPSMDIGVKEIDRWHRARQWLCIGYHWVIRRSGAIEEGREQERAGAHARGYNQKSVGVCMVGGVDDEQNAEDNFTGAQWQSLEGLLGDLRGDYPQAEIIGHNEVAAKACPSFDVQEWLKDKPFLIRDPEPLTECPHPNCPMRDE